MVQMTSLIIVINLWFFIGFGFVIGLTIGLCSMLILMYKKFDSFWLAKEGHIFVPFRTLMISFMVIMVFETIVIIVSDKPMYVK